MMLMRKKGRRENKEEEKFDSDGIPYEIFGEGIGLDDIKKLFNKFNKEAGNPIENEWEECDSEGKVLENSDDSRSIEVDEEDFLECFILENTKCLNSGSFKCNLCNNNKKISPMNIDIHFSEKHKVDYEKSEYNDMCKKLNNF